MTRNHRLLLSLVAASVSTLVAASAHATCLTTAQAQLQVNTKAAANPWIGSPVGSLTWLGNGWMQQYSNKQRPTIWLSQCGNTGAHIVQGLIEDHYAAAGGGASSPYGYPTTDELATVTNDGRVSYFSDGAIFYNSSVGTYGMHGWIWRKYHSMDTINSGLGYPKSDEKALSNSSFSGRINDMQYGWMVYDSSAQPWNWLHATWPIYNWPHSNAQGHVMAETTQSDQLGGTVQVYVFSGFGAKSPVTLYLDTWHGRWAIASGTTDANGYFAFPEHYIENNDAGGGNSTSGFIATFEVEGANGAFVAVAVTL